MKNSSILILVISVILLSCGTETKSTYILDVDVSPVEAGSISPSIGQFNKGEEITLTPSPNEYWVFENWSGDVNSTSNPLTITMDNDKSIIAHFVKKKYPLNISIIGEGSVEEQIIPQKITDYDHGTLVELNPVPAKNWKFKMWSGNIESSEKLIQITVDREINLTVTFKNKFYVHENGKTIMCPETSSGDVGLIEGVEYLSVDRELFDEVKSSTDLAKVCVSLVENMDNLFTGYEEFNSNIENWDVSNVVTMRGMFFSVMLDQSINHWDVSNVTDMGYMFTNSSFDQSIDEWDVSNVERMDHMFLNSSFNQPIGDWDVQSVHDMRSMFNGSSFNQDISSWCVENIQSEPENFSTDSPLTEENKPVWGTCPSN